MDLGARDVSVPDNVCMQEAIEVLKGQLYFWVARSSDAVRAAASVGLVLQIDSELTYEPFASDFGPLHLGCTYRFCNKLKCLLRVRLASSAVLLCSPTFVSVKLHGAVVYKAMVSHGCAYRWRQNKSNL